MNEESLCLSCYYRNFHHAGSFYSVAEGGDDPYAYWYCVKGHWADEAEDPPQINECPDYNKDLKGDDAT